MAIELSRAELLCRALHLRGLSKDWYLLSASEQAAMAEAVDALADEFADDGRKELRDVEVEIASRGFGFYFDSNGEEHFVRGDRELCDVVSMSIAEVGDEAGDEAGDAAATRVRIVFRNLVGGMRRVPDQEALIDALVEDGIDVVRTTIR